jgi:hypothetical protein
MVDAHHNSPYIARGKHRGEGDGSVARISWRKRRASFPKGFAAYDSKTTVIKRRRFRSCQIFPLRSESRTSLLILET